MRVFLAVDLRDTMGEAAQAWGAAVATAIGARAAAGLTWVPPPRIHVTLHFFGELTPGDVDQVRQALGEAVPGAAFDLRLGDGGVFPPSGRPRVLWLGFADGAGALARLHDWIAPRVAGVARQPDRHAGFTPHLTVARVRRESSPGLGRALRDAAARTPPPDARARVEGVTLFQSVSSGQGPSYVPLARVPLA